MDYLVELCKEGRFAGVGMGVPEATARAVLGTPDDESVSDDPHVLVYGGFELAFTGGELEMITLGFGRILHVVPEKLAGEVPRQWSETDRDGVVDALAERGVTLTPHAHPGAGVFDYCATTVLGDLVNVTFTGERLTGVVCARADRTAPRIAFLPPPVVRRPPVSH